MTEGQILFDCRAFDQMGYQSTQIVKRYKDAFRDQPNSDQFEEFLKVRYMSIQCLAIITAIDVKKVVIYWLLLQNQSILRLIFRHESQSESPSVALRNTLLNQKLKEIPQSIWNELSLIDYQRRAPEEYDSGQASSNYEAQSEQGTRHDEDNEMTPTLLGPGDFLQGTGFQLKSELKDWEGSTYSEMVGVNPLPRFPTIELTSSDVTRWKMASCFIEESERAHHNANAFSTNMMHRRCKDWPDVDLIFELPIALGFGVAALIYGGLHALAWSAHFDSLTEQLLWRMSACVVMGGVPICYIITSLGVYYQDHFAISMGEKYWFRAMEKVFNVSIYLWLALIYLILLAYILARAYLVVESFINLSDLPAGAYDLPRWSTYFPHFS